MLQEHLAASDCNASPERTVLVCGANWLNQCIAMGNVHNWLLYNLFKLVKQTPLTRPSLEVFLLEEGNTVLRREK